MSQLKDTSFADRRKSSNEAKLKLLERFKAAPKPDDPEMVAKRAEREALAKARELRRTERKHLKQAKLKAEKEEAEAKAKAEADAREASLKELADRVIADEAERKAKRDKKYAARKARQR